MSKEYFKPPVRISLFERRKLQAAKKEERLKSILETILDIPIEHLKWDELKEYTKLDKHLTIEEVMHLAQVKKAISGDSTAYKALLERAKGKIPTKSIAVSTDYKTFLENAMASEKQAIGTDSDIPIPKNAKVTITHTFEDDLEDLDDNDNHSQQENKYDDLEDL